MRIMISRLILITILGIGCWIPDHAMAQDSIKVEDIRPFAYSFDIANGVLTGKGAAVLTKAVSNAHVVMLGNNSRNKLESDFDIALSSVLDKNNYKTLIMEIGPASASIVNRLSNDSEET
jgi:hypothetical protein